MVRNLDLTTKLPVDKTSMAREGAGEQKHKWDCYVLVSVSDGKAIEFRIRGVNKAAKQDQRAIQGPVSRPPVLVNHHCMSTKGSKPTG